MRTRADLAPLCRRLPIERRKQIGQGSTAGLSENERYRVAGDVVNQLEKGGWRLSERLPWRYREGAFDPAEKMKA
jgi:hypothetical protein